LDNNSGLTFSGGKLKVNAQVCGGDAQVLTWVATGFNCVSGTDFFLKANNESGSGYQIADNGVVNFNNGTGLTASRTNHSISYGLANANVDTSDAANCDASNASAGGYYVANSNPRSGTVYIPQLTVDVYGRVTKVDCKSVNMPAAQTLTITTGANGTITLSNGGSFGVTKGLTINNEGKISVNLTNSRGLTFNGRSVALPSCNVKGGFLKWNNDEGLYYCGLDNDEKVGWVPWLTITNGVAENPGSCIEDNTATEITFGFRDFLESEGRDLKAGHFWVGDYGEGAPHMLFSYQYNSTDGHMTIRASRLRQTATTVMVPPTTKPSTKTMNTVELTCDIGSNGARLYYVYTD
jgi:hypothetical protein